MRQELVKNWMNPNVITVSSDTALPEAHRLMTEHRIRRLPVLEDGRLVGIVTLGDVREAEPSNATSLSIWELNYLLSRLPVSEIMTENPQTILQDATVGEAAHIMLTYRVSGLPVVDNTGAIIGIVTESDIFRMVAQEWQA